MKKVMSILLLAICVFGMVACEGDEVEEQIEVFEVNEDTEVYWTAFGKVYHLPTGDVDKYGYETFCSSLNASDAIYYGTVRTAKEEGRSRLCSECMKRENAIIKE